MTHKFNERAVFFIWKPKRLEAKEFQANQETTHKRNSVALDGRI
jgi:hypothetical protein